MWCVISVSKMFVTQNGMWCVISVSKMSVTQRTACGVISVSKTNYFACSCTFALRLNVIIFIFTVWHKMAHLQDNHNGARWSSGTASDFRSRGPGFKTTCGRASDFSVEGIGVQNHQLPFQNLGKFVHPTLLVSFGRDTKSCWSLLPGVYARGRGSKRSHTGGKCVTCCGLRVVVSISNPPIPGK